MEQITTELTISSKNLVGAPLGQPSLDVTLLIHEALSVTNTVNMFEQISVYNGESENRCKISQTLQNMYYKGKPCLAVLTAI